MLDDKFKHVNTSGSHVEQTDCMTIPGGRMSHTPCMFPFNFGGVNSILSCIITSNEEEPWCPTRTDINGDMVTGHWGNCKKTCPGKIL